MNEWQKKVVFSTPWFSLVEKTIKSDQYYSLDLPDYVSVIAVTPDKKLILVKQFRAALEGDSLELPSGTVDKGESPLTAVRRELLEETGYQATKLVSLAPPLHVDVGRLSNHVWLYYAECVKVDGHPGEAGIEVSLHSFAEMKQMILEGKFTHTPNIVAFLYAAWGNYLPVDFMAAIQ